MIKATECAGMHTGPGILGSESMLCAGEFFWISRVRSAPCVKSARAIKALAIRENTAVRDIAMVIEEKIVATPIVAPVSPSPVKTAEETDSNACAPEESGARNIQSWIPVPIGPNGERLSIYEPWVILRNINNLNVGWLDLDRLPLIADRLLRCCLQVAGLLCTLAHDLNSVHHVLLLVDVSVAQR